MNIRQITLSTSIGLICFAIVGSAQAGQELFFTTDPIPKRNPRASNGPSSLDTYQKEIQACLQRLTQNGNQSSYAQCLERAQSSFATGISLSRPKVIDDCADAGYVTCFNARVSASIVQIESSTSGTGVIIGDNGKAFLIATSRHVVDGIAKNEKGDVIWQGRSIGSFTFGDIWKSPNYDLAIIRFKSKVAIPPVPIALATANYQGKSVTVAGFPLVTDLNKDGRKVFRISSGSVSSQVPLAGAVDGYAIGYTAPTTAGMSGGGVFASVNCKRLGPVMATSPIPLLIGIHGRAESNETKGATGFNYAVPGWAINEYPDIASFLDTTRSRANFGCPYGYDNKIDVFMD